MLKSTLTLYLLSFLSLTLTACGDGGLSVQTGEAREAKETKKFPETRNVYKWPFAQNSIWNTPIGSDAEYVPAGIQPALTRTLRADQDVIILSPDAPLTPVYKNNVGWRKGDPGGRCRREGEKLVDLPIPLDFVANHGSSVPNMAAAILKPDGRTLYQTQPFHRCQAGEYATSKHVFPEADIYGGGILGAHGGSGLSSIGGTIRLGELVPNGVIRHALKVNIYGGKNISYTEDDTPGYRWPAIRADKRAKRDYHGVVPELEMGALLALKPDFDLNSLQTEPGRILARAFIDYGGYVADHTGWDIYAITTQLSPEGRVLDEFKNHWGYTFNQNGVDNPWAQDIRTIFTNLHVVDNNTPETPGGGGTPRQPLAPPFAEAESE